MRWIAFGCCALAFAVLGPARAGPVTGPVAVHLDGTEAVRVRVADGRNAPCDASDNRPLIDAIVKPGAPLAVKSAAECVCYEQTFAPFTSTGWSPPQIRCRPLVCEKKKCFLDMSAEIRITVRSRN